MISVYVFFFNDTATTEIYTLSLHDALPIYLPIRLGTPSHPTSARVTWRITRSRPPAGTPATPRALEPRGPLREDRKSTRLNSSHANISYAVFCLKKK